MNLSYIICYLILPLLVAGLLGLFLGWLLFRGKKQDGDLSIEGEGALKAEADQLRAENQSLRGRIATSETDVSDLKSKLALAGAAAAAGGAVAASASNDDESYALEWRNRYLAARVKYLEGRLGDSAEPKKKAPAKKAPAKKKPALKATAKPKVLYTDGPTEGTPDDLKVIKGIGPKFEKDLNSKGIYYYRQIAAWKAADVKMVEGVIDSIPGRIKRDEWVKQAKGFATKGVAPKAKRKPGPKPGTKRGALTATGAPRKKPGPKPSSAKPKMSAAEAAFEKYYTNVKKYDPKAKRKSVENIVKYCGIALKSRDSSLVACSDEAELKRVADGFVTKKLGKTTGQMELVKDVCQEMKSDRFKSRVTFYYLAAKKARKMSIFA
ncbi:putative flap endonuclease-1-like 5' DNA nuclease [Litorimonas taeanensis]|uniref:Putative flap endonuclease-1-like 5' DNA nuclease n=1 Tax=Litorimonas taeanensis TaxID=568099 RepID=A0A420WK94_9PROT|nr:DUF2853 family protein [Litorimonas taeanensis]RKQ71325.1 putative flap endonuclease-1-like 5' DNA nuclease [Litorimonas taeanensis]